MSNPNLTNNMEKARCDILDDDELQNLKPQSFEKRSWTNTILQNSRPFDKGFIKNTNFPFAFNKKQSHAKVYPIISTVYTNCDDSLVNKVKFILNEEPRPRSRSPLCPPTN